MEEHLEYLSNAINKQDLLTQIEENNSKWLLLFGYFARNETYGKIKSALMWIELEWRLSVGLKIRCQQCFDSKDFFPMENFLVGLFYPFYEKNKKWFGKWEPMFSQQCNIFSRKFSYITCYLSCVVIALLSVILYLNAGLPTIVIIFFLFSTFLTSIHEYDIQCMPTNI